MIRLLLVDDDPAFVKVYKRLLVAEGYEVTTASDRPEAHDALESTYFDVVLLDLMLPPDGSVRGGLDQLKRIVSDNPGTRVIVASGAGDTQFMVDAVKHGAYDFLTKPVDPDVLLIVVQRAAARARLERELGSLRESLTAKRPDDSMIGQSPAFSSAVDLARRVAATTLPVLITGENGTGKELIARFVHSQSPRHDRPFLAVNCAALAESVLDSTLFGHVKGAFTGAVRDRPGLLVEADSGTLFLDEIGDMPEPLQVKLLRVLETGDILPVGADRPRNVDVRIVSATNRDLGELQRDGAFREDLYWRVNGAQVHLPPLRDRLPDIELLAAHFLNQAASVAPDGLPRRLSAAALEALRAHTWPGNLRELRHEMQRATVLAAGRQTLEPQDFVLAAPAHETLNLGTLQEKIEALEKSEIEAALSRHNGNRSRAAEELGLSRQGLLNKINRYAL